MSVTVYGLSRCDTCVKARKWLNENAIEHVFVDYRDHPVSPAVLVEWAGKVGGWDKLVNRASTTWRQLGDEKKSVHDEAGWLALIAEYPTLVRRPVLVTPDGAVSVGFKAQAWAQRFGV